MCKKIFFKSPFGMRSDSRLPNQLENPQNRIPNETIPVHVVNQPNPGRAIPIEPHGPHVSGHKNKNVTFSYPTLQSSESKGQGSTRVSDQSDSRRDGVKETKHKNAEDDHKDDPNKQARQVEDKNNVAEDKFSDYISKVKNKLRTVSPNVGAATARTTVGRRDSFNNKVSNYISRAKIKMRSMTMVGNDNNK